MLAKNLVLAVFYLLVMVVAVIRLVERPGDGTTKRAEAIEALQAGVALLPIPPWFKLLASNESFLGWLVDLQVKALNKTGWFSDVDPTDAPLPPSGSSEGPGT